MDAFQLPDGLLKQDIDAEYNPFNNEITLIEKIDQ